jgi:hypothetical protein
MVVATVPPLVAKHFFDEVRELQRRAGDRVRRPSLPELDDHDHPLPGDDRVVELVAGQQLALRACFVARIPKGAALRPF